MSQTRCGGQQEGDPMGVVGQETVRPVMLMRGPVAMAVAALGTEDLHRRIVAIRGATGEPVAFGLKGCEPSRRRVGTTVMRPGMSHLAQHSGQEHERSEQHPDAADNGFRHATAGSIRAPRLSSTQRSRLGVPPAGGFDGTP